MIHGYTGEDEQAIACYTEAIRLNPDLAQAYHFRGYAYRKLGKDVKAAADRAKAEKLWGFPSSCDL
jgi:tetratricopeptide (TPR) repeat protein